MEVEVKLYGVIRRHRPQSAEGEPHHPFSITVPENTSVLMLAQILGVPDGLVNAAAVNGEAVTNDTLLQAGDKVSLFPPAAGG